MKFELDEGCIAEIWTAVDARVHHLERELRELTAKAALQPWNRTIKRAVKETRTQLRRCRSIEDALDRCHEVRVTIEPVDTACAGPARSQRCEATVLPFRPAAACKPGPVL